VLPEGRGNVIVVADSCGMNNTFLIRGSADIEFVGTGDRHDKAFANTETFFEFEFDTHRQNEGSYCHQHIHMFATRAMKASFETNAPILYATVIVLLFLFTEVVFLFYDSMVNARQNRTQTKADTQEAIVQELFPGNVAAKLYKRESMDVDDDNDHGADSSLLNGMLGGSKDSSGAARTTIADLYPAATVLCTCLCVIC
jgi:hypothetical protein